MSLANVMGLPESHPRQPNIDGDIDARQFPELPPQGNQRYMIIFSLCELLDGQETENVFR